jgi:hypothetical protein
MKPCQFRLVAADEEGDAAAAAITTVAIAVGGTRSCAPRVRIVRMTRR